LRAQVLLRIDRLLPAQKLVLKIVAVAGTNATRDLIAEVRPCFRNLTAFWDSRGEFCWLADRVMVQGPLSSELLGQLITPFLPLAHFPPPFSLSQVAPAQFSPEELQTELEYLVSVDILVRDTRNGYCFRHEMVNEVVLGFLTFSQKRLLHKRIANYHITAQEDVSPSTLANHFEHAARGMDNGDLDVPAAKRAIWFLKVPPLVCMFT